jgi:hypothetical protein
MLYPAMFLLVAGFAAVVISFGAAIAEWAARTLPRGERPDEEGGEGENSAYGPFGEELERLDGVLRRSGASWDDVENFWRTVRLRRWKRLDYLRILARLGPAMGLVGTLIPMSTGLASLSQGDTSRLSSDLVVAFSTTVVGLCSGVGAHILYTVRSRWLEDDLQSLQIAIEARAAGVLDRAEDES